MCNLMVLIPNRCLDGVCLETLQHCLTPDKSHVLIVVVDGWKRAAQDRRRRVITMNIYHGWYHCDSSHEWISSS